MQRCSRRWADGAQSVAQRFSLKRVYIDVYIARARNSNLKYLGGYPLQVRFLPRASKYHNELAPSRVRVTLSLMLRLCPFCARSPLLESSKPPPTVNGQLPRSSLASRI